MSTRSTRRHAVVDFPMKFLLQNGGQPVNHGESRTYCNYYLTASFDFLEKINIDIKQCVASTLE